MYSTIFLNTQVWNLYDCNLLDDKIVYYKEFAKNTFNGISGITPRYPLKSTLINDYIYTKYNGAESSVLMQYWNQIYVPMHGGVTLKGQFISAVVRKR